MHLVPELRRLLSDTMTCENTKFIRILPFSFAGMKKRLTVLLVCVHIKLLNKKVCHRNDVYFNDPFRDSKRSESRLRVEGQQ